MAMIEIRESDTTGKILPVRKNRSLEYELIASLAVHQYLKKGVIDFEALLSIPLKERIPGLVAAYGLKRTHRLINSMLNEFCSSISLPKSKKLSDTKTSVCSCDLILVAEEDQLSMEDLIIFFEQARKGKYGKFKSLLTHYSIMEKLEQFRQERYQAYVLVKEEIELSNKMTGPLERISPEPTPIRQLFAESGAKIIPFNK